MATAPVIRKNCPHCGVELEVAKNQFGEDAVWALTRCPACEESCLVKSRPDDLSTIIPSFLQASAEETTGGYCAAEVSGKLTRVGIAVYRRSARNRRARTGRASVFSRRASEMGRFSAVNGHGR